MISNSVLALLISMTWASSPVFAANKCIDSVNSQSLVYPRITAKNETISYEGMTSSMGLHGEIRNVYFEKLINEFDLFNFQGPLKIKFPKEGFATVEAINDFGSKGILFTIGKEKREVRVLEKSLLEAFSEKDDSNIKLGRSTFAKSQRYEGRDVGQALELLALHVSGNSKKISDLKLQVQRAYEQIEIDYFSVKELAQVVPSLVAVLRDGKSKIDEPSPQTQKTVLKEIGKVDFIRSWMVGDFDHVVSYYTQGKNSFLRIWTSTGEGIGLITTLDLNTFSISKPRFDFKSSLGHSSLTVDTKAGHFKWSEGRNPTGEELRLVFTLELLKLKIEEL